MRIHIVQHFTMPIYCRHFLSRTYGGQIAALSKLIYRFDTFEGESMVYFFMFESINL